MSATSSLTARPPWAHEMWCDDTHIYVELPSTNGAPFIMKFSLTEGGLSKALNFMRTEHHKHQPQGGYYVVPDFPITRKGPEVKATERTRESTRAILKRLNLI